MNPLPGFSLAVSQNRYLSTEDKEMHAVLTVRAGGAAGPGAAPEVAEVIVIDCSGSMGYPPTKIRAAQRATRAAIDALRGGALFAVVEGTNNARMVYPAAQKLVSATLKNRTAAKKAVAGLQSGGGTEIGKWLNLARQLLAAHPTAVRHAILLTDGQDREPPGALERELAACAPVFSCDSRGIGEDWDPRELMRIAEVLHGAADAVPEPADLAADFAALTRSAMAKLVPEVRILINTTTFAQVDFLRQKFPTESALDGTAVRPRTTAFATGSWGSETREFHLRLRVDPAGRELERDIRIARVDLQLRRPGSTEFENVGDPAVVFAHWTDDLKLSSIIDPKVAHYTNQTELGEAVRRGCDAHDRGDQVTAAAEWGRAVALATALDNDKVLTRLLRLVEVVGDPADGVVRIKVGVRAVDLLSAFTGSSYSSMSADPAAPAKPAGTVSSAPGVSCPVCHREWAAGSKFCGACGHQLGESA